MTAMTIFDTSADDYDRFMGRYLPSLAPAFVEAAGVAQGMCVLDIGCGPGGVTHELAERVGADNVAAVDPAPQFVRACASRNPGVDVREGAAGESGMAGTARGDIAERMHRVGVIDVVEGHVDAHADYRDFDEFWGPFTLGVGPAGRYLRSLLPDRRGRVRAACRESLPDGPFRIDARAWMAWGTTISGPVVDRRG